MKNKNRKTNISLKKKLLAINILVVMIILIPTSFGILTLRNEANLTTIISDFNQLYTEAARYINKNDYNSETYLNELSEYRKAKMAIVDKDGNMIMKSENVMEDHIDMEYMRKVFQDGIEDGNIYQRYSIYIDGKEETLFIWKEFQPQSKGIRNFLIITISSIVVAIMILYYFISKKVVYIKELSEGANNFAEGNLNYTLKEHGNDELHLLASSMNSMAKNLEERIDKERQEERFRTELITNVSHDLRTPLTSLIGYLQLLENSKISNDDKTKYAKIALDKSYKLKNLIEELFEYSKLECDHIVLEKSEINIIEVIEQSIGELFAEANKKNMHFSKDFSASDIKISIDSEKIGRVFENLLNNSIKYGVDGTEIYINVKSEEDSVRITIKNYMEKDKFDDIKSVFNRFYRGDSSRNSKIDGSGLGLAIAKDIIELHQGEIWAESKDNIFSMNIKLQK